jgi:hypothetical protein
MNPAEKFILRDKLKTKMPNLTDDVAYDVLSYLDQLGALVKEWNDESALPKAEKPSNGLPESFNMVSPMWQGHVKLCTREGFVGYQDGEGNMRVFDKTERGLAKKIVKYRK